jgi:PhnB protein
MPGQTSSPVTSTSAHPGKPNITVNPYLFFGGRCEEAIEFYKKALGAEVGFLMRFKDGPDQSMTPPGCGDKVLHARLEIGSTVAFVSDGRCEGKTDFQGFSLSINVPTEADADRIFAALAEGGKVDMPLCKTFFSPRFGMVDDRFGVAWLVIVERSV